MREVRNFAEGISLRKIREESGALTYIYFRNNCNSLKKHLEEYASILLPECYPILLYKL